MLLSGNLGGQPAELIDGPIDLAPRLLALAAIHLDAVRQAPGRPARHGRHRLQLAQQLGGRRGGLAPPLHFQKQLRLLQNPPPHRRRTAAPGGIQLPGLARMTLVAGEGFGHPLAIFQTGARYRRQELHRDVGRDLPRTHLLLHALGKLIDQRQTARHPTHAAIEAARELVEAVPKAPLQLRQQPAFLQRRLALPPVQRTVQHHRLGLGHRPDHCLDRVAAELLNRRDTLVAVDHQVTVRLTVQGHHHDRRLLAIGGQRGQQLALPVRAAHPQSFPAPVELVKFQLHSGSSVTPVTQVLSLPELGSSLSPRGGELWKEVLWNQRRRDASDLARHAGSVCS